MRPCEGRTNCCVFVIDSIVPLYCWESLSFQQCATAETQCSVLFLFVPYDAQTSSSQLGVSLHPCTCVIVVLSMHQGNFWEMVCSLGGVVLVCCFVFLSLCQRSMLEQSGNRKPLCCVCCSQNVWTLIHVLSRANCRVCESFWLAESLSHCVERKRETDITNRESTFSLKRSSRTEKPFS